MPILSKAVQLGGRTMRFKVRRAKRPDAHEVAPAPAEFEHSSGATNLEGVVGEHTLTEAAEAAAPKGYRARSVAKSDERR
jgi:hypothetical protein